MCQGRARLRGKVASKDAITDGTLQCATPTERHDDHCHHFRGGGQYETSQRHYFRTSCHLSGNTEFDYLAHGILEYDVRGIATVGYWENGSGDRGRVA